MKFVFVFGPQAVGKMTVGQELEKTTDLKLLHNHMTIDLLVPLFGYSPEMWRLCHMFREEIFKSVANSELYGIIFTAVWAFNESQDWEYIEKICGIFRKSGADIYFVELEASVEERLRRNQTSNRLEHKPSKRNVKESEHHLLSTIKTLRLNSNEGEITEAHYLRINNTRLSAEEAAKRIKAEFQL